jgi:translation initiation factor 1
MSSNARPVYSSEHGRLCPGCGRPQGDCNCKAPRSPVGDGIVRVRRESKGRGGKKVTAVTGIPLAAEPLKALAADLKRRCGSGGTVKDGTIEIQGDHVPLLIEELAKRGFKVKRAGG